MDVPSLSEYSLSSFQIQEIAVDNILNGNISLSSFSIPEIDVGKFTLTPDILRTIRIKDSKSSTLSLNRKLAVWRTQ